MTTLTKSPRAGSPTWLKMLRQRPPKDYVHPYLGGFLLGLVLFAAFFLTGNGLGASGGLNRYLVYVQDMFVP
ncbi:MAG TPA: hypothetical protein PK954_10925, partial [Anaerolineales bacterium]|nr:hypothetical protein [Anaerolineales bacterium]